MNSSKPIWNISRRTKWLAPWLAIIIAINLALPALSQGPTLVGAEVTADFPQSITFNVKAQSSAPITKLVLRYQVERLACFPEIAERHPDFVPGRTVQAQWTWQMKKSGGLPPGTRLSYQWLMEDAQGQRLKTGPATFSFEDPRYPWQSLAQGNLKLFWYQGDESFAQELLGAGLGALERLGKETGITLNRETKLYIYGDSDALQGARIFPQPWEGGVAFTDYATVAIGISPVNLDWGRRAIAHELAHQVTYQATNNCYSDLPTWLSEGIAMYAEGPLSPAMKSRLDKAIGSDTLFSVPTLASSFPVQAEAALLSYAQSFSLVEFLLGFGRDKLNQLLYEFRAGSSYDEALLKAYNLDMKSLDAAWRQSLGLPPRPIPTPVPVTSIAPTLTPSPQPPSPTPQSSPSPGFLSCERGSKGSKDIGSLLFAGLFLSLGVVHLWQRNRGR